MGHIETGLVSARRRGDRLSTYIALYNLSQVAASRGEGTVARRHLEEGLRLSMETRDLANLAHFLEVLAVVEGSERAHDRVPVLLGAAQGLREMIGTVGYGYYRPDQELAQRAEGEARERLGDDTFDDALDAGRTLEAGQAVAFALGGPLPAEPGPVPPAQFPYGTRCTTGVGGRCPPPRRGWSPAHPPLTASTYRSHP